jgi:Ca-activated chloride channel family protein
MVELPPTVDGMSILRDIGLSAALLPWALAVYALVFGLATWLSYRRGGRGLVLWTAASMLLSLGLFVGGAMLLSRPPAWLQSGLQLAGTARVDPRALALPLGARVLVIERPVALLLLAFLPLLLPALRTSLTDMSRLQLWAQLGMRGLLALFVTLALSQPALLGERTRLSTVALVDVSDSVSDAQLVQVGQRIDELRALSAQRGDDLHVVTFAGRPGVLPDPRRWTGPTTVETLRRPAGQRQAAQAWLRPDSSNLQAALQLSYGLHAPDTLRRAVLFSDGLQTEGDVTSEALSARRRGVRVGYFPLPAEAAAEVLVRELRLLSDSSEATQIKVGAPFTLEGEIYSSVAQRVRATLFQSQTSGERENPGDGHRDLDLLAGRNLVRFRSQIDSAGVTSYRLQLAAVPGAGGAADGLKDRFASNNQALLPLFARGRPRILYIEGENAAKSYLAQALTRENIEVETRGPYGLPSRAKDLLGFDLVLLSDVSATLVSQAQMTAIESYVRDFGGGFIMAGGENSFGSGGYQGTQLEKVLPVRFEQEKKRDQPSLALILAIDRSGSMSGRKLELAKDAARATAEMLGADDLIGVVAFDSQAMPLVRLQRAQNRVRISSDIARLTAGGGTQLLPPLQEAYQQLAAATAKIKHVILLTDGQAEYQGILELVNQMVAQKITVSTVGVGSGADQTLLTAIAENGGGRFYYTQDESSIPKIFTKETTQVARSALVEDRVRPVVAKFVELLDGVGIESAPALRGYVSTKAKPLSETILVSPQGEPLLVRWRQGLGQVVAFTSDVKNRWAVDWLRWPGYARFWAQLVRSSMRHDSKNRGPGYQLSAAAVPPYVQVRVDAISSDDRFVSGLDTQLEIFDNTEGRATQSALGGAGGAAAASTLQKGPILSLPLPQTAPGRYETEVYLPRTGAFMLRAVHRGAASGGGPGPVVAESWGTLSLSYSREYLALPPDQDLLDRIAQTTFGARYDSADAALSRGGETLRYLRPLWLYLVGAAIAALLLDVLLRRVRLFGYRRLSL